MRLRKPPSLTFVFTGRNKDFTAQTPNEIHRDVQSLNLIFNGSSTSVYLVGGIGMAIRKNHFYRNHRDLDIAIFTEDIIPFFKHMKSKGYRILHKYFSGHVSPKHNLQIGSDICIEKIVKSDPDRIKIRLLRSGPAHLVNIGQRTDYFDVFFLGRSSRGVLLHGYNAFTPWSDFYPLYPVIEGANLLLPNINYKRHLFPKNEKESLDFRMAGLIPA